MRKAICEMKILVYEELLKSSNWEKPFGEKERGSGGGVTCDCGFCEFLELHKFVYKVRQDLHLAH